MTRPVDPDTGEIQVRPFADFLREQAHGTSHDELSDSLHALVEAVKDTGRKGTLTYTISVEPLKGSDALSVTDAIKVRPPEHDRPGSVFWADHNGNLTRSDPTQLSFDSLREVTATSSTEIRDITKENA